MAAGVGRFRIWADQCPPVWAIPANPGTRQMNLGWTAGPKLIFLSAFLREFCEETYELLTVYGKNHCIGIPVPRA